MSTLFMFMLYESFIAKRSKHPNLMLLVDFSHARLVISSQVMLLQHIEKKCTGFVSYIEHATSVHIAKAGTPSTHRP